MLLSKLFGFRLSRYAWSAVLVGAAAVAIIAAIALQSLGLGLDHMTPLAFVSAAVFVKLGLFTFWPLLVEKGSQASTRLQTGLTPVFTSDRRETLPRRKLRPSRHINLWDDSDVRLDASVFHANVPTLIISADQRLVDWNPSFKLIFGHITGVKRGMSMTDLYLHFDNFKGVKKRSQKLYGEAVLPLTDRERVSFVSPRYGRMSFTRLLSPIIDGNSARIIGWTVTLNINSVGKRKLLFDELFAAIEHDAGQRRYAAGFDALFNRYQPYRDLLRAHARDLFNCQRILEINAGTGNLTHTLLKDGSKVTAVDSATHSLRRLRSKLASYRDRLSIIRRHADNLGVMPKERYDGVAMMLGLHRVSDPQSLFRRLYDSMAPGAVISLSAIEPAKGIESVYASLKESLSISEDIDVLKHQFASTFDFERILATRELYQYHDRASLRAWLLEAGFDLTGDDVDLLSGNVFKLTAVKP